MPLVVDVPLNTMLADLDESLRTLFRRELERKGFDGVEISFDAPAKDWSSQLAAPTVNLFLYDLREAGEHKHRSVEEQRSNGAARETRPPLVVDASYAVTAWTQDVEDEHRLLSQVLALLYSYPRLPDDVLVARLRNGSQRYPVNGRVGHAKADGKADFWNAIGGHYKASIDYVVTLSCEAGTAWERGPEVRSQTLRVGDPDGPPGTILELHRVGGRVTRADGEPLGDVWIILPESGLWATTNADGRFVVNRVPPGTHRLVARTRDGEELEAEMTAPGKLPDLVVGRPTRRAGKTA